MHLFVFQYIFTHDCCKFSPIHSCAFRKLFCGEKLQRSWGKETSTSATSRLSQEPSQWAQSSRRCEAAAMNWKHTHRRTPTLHCWTARGVRAAPRSPWTEKCLYTWKHITSLQTSPPLLPPTRSPLHCFRCELCDHHHSLPQDSKHTHIQTHKHTIQVGWMLKVKARVQIKPTHVRHSETENTHTHTHKWSHTVSVCRMHYKTGAKTEKEELAAVDHHTIYPLLLQQELLLFAYLESDYPGLSLASSLPHPLQNDTL